MSKESFIQACKDASYSVDLGEDLRVFVEFTHLERFLVNSGGEPPGSYPGVNFTIYLPALGPQWESAVRGELAGAGGKFMVETLSLGHLAWGVHVVRQDGAYRRRTSLDYRGPSCRQSLAAAVADAGVLVSELRARVAQNAAVRAENLAAYDR